MSKQSDPHEWLAFAKEDLAAARLLLTDADLPARIACFHAQQAPEKALKASLVHAGIDCRRVRCSARQCKSQHGFVTMS